MSGDPDLQALRAFANSTAACRNESRSGYGGISEKISRLGDILRRLETKRSVSAGFGKVGYGVGGEESNWPPPTLRCAGRLFETRAAGKTACDEGLGRGGVAAAAAEGWPGRGLSGGGGMIDTLRRQGRSSVIESPGPVWRRHHLHHLLPHQLHLHHLRNAAGSVLTPCSAFHAHDPCTTPSCHGQLHAGFGCTCLPMPHEDPNVQIPSPTHFYPPSIVGDSKPSPVPPLLLHHTTPNASPPRTGTLSVDDIADIARTILARLDSLEMQQNLPSSNKSTPRRLQRPTKKGLACKLGGEQKISRQGKGSISEKGLIQFVRSRRVRDDSPQTHEREDFLNFKESPSKQEVQEYEKRLQRLESELELCWSAINQLCVDNEQFREEQRRLNHRIGPLLQLNENSLQTKHVEKNKVSSKGKIRGNKPNHMDLELQENESSG
ncbi:hypothetical protein KP509_33G025900 [Ceratopteris richardii]|uniref:Uncharacterized protein n=1 Tax=Ceratopteris richardii TaxID=49495 RepID=A0A8T2QPG0_CERRI|nr:hypothetical protein KP509_33G025900 [Ceratopteris richardii]